MKQGNILLGMSTETGPPVSINLETRATHMHIIGSTGEGKSKFMEHLNRDDIINNNGLCLIDPHGHLYDDVVRWCETKRFLGRRKIILFNPSEEEWTFGFNPLHLNTPDLSFQVDAMVKACAKVWGGEDTDKTPLLKRCLRVVFHVLAEKQMSLLESQHLINPVDSTCRWYLTQGIKDPIIREQWDYFNSLKPKPFYDEFGSTINRMMEFLSSPIIRNIIGQTQRIINFREIMDQGYILLINLAPKGKISDDNARLLGSLIVNDLFINARCRPEGSRPFYLYMDECGRYINEDIGRILDEGRKFGLHLILAHQHLSQLKKAGEDTYHSVMTDAKTKVIFGGLDADDAEILARQIFLGELDLEEPKEILNKPTVIGYIKTWLQNYSHSKGHSSGGGHSTGKGINFLQSQSESTTTTPLPSGDNQKTKTRATQSGLGSSFHEEDSSTWSDNENEAQGAAEALMPILEEMPTQTYNLEEQIYKAMALMVNQPTQHAIIKRPKQHTQMAKTPTIDPGYARNERVQRFEESCYRLVDFVRPKLEVEKELQERRIIIENRAKEALNPPAEYPTTFREPKEEIVLKEPESFREPRVEMIAEEVKSFGEPSEIFGQFMQAWIELERVSKPTGDVSRPAAPLPTSVKSELTKLRRIRNEVVHGDKDHSEITPEMVERVRKLTAKFEQANKGVR